MLRLRAFSAPVVERDGTPLGGAARQRRVLALLTILAEAGPRGVSRDRILGLLWSESDADRARQALTQSLYHARRALEQDDLFAGAADLMLNAEVITSDIGEFEGAIERGELQRAADLYTGPFLDGFFVTGAPEFERWVEAQRTRFQQQYSDALDHLAAAAEARTDHRDAVQWRKRLAALDPLNSRIALDLIRTLAAAGDRAGAIRHAQVHETLLREELGAAPNPAIVELADRLREESVWKPNPFPIPEVQPDVRAETRAFPAVESAPPAPDGQGRVPKPPWRTSARMFITAGITASLLLAAALAVVLDRRAGASQSVSADLIVVSPFRVSGAAGSLAFLREGLVDLMALKLAESANGPAADPGTVLSAWRRAGLAASDEVRRDDALELARRLGGQRVVIGSVVGTPVRMIISASLLGVAPTEVRAQASAEGPVDSLTVLVDRLVARLLAKEAGEWERLASHTSASAAALRAYLEGRAAYRQGRYQDAVSFFGRALSIDRRFAAAALGLADAADRLGLEPERARGLAAAWAARDALSTRDSAYLSAMAGPDYPDPSSPRDRLAAWEMAAATAGGRAEIWHELGERLFHDGRMLEVPDSDARASAAFRRAASLDPSFASPWQYLVQLSAGRGDTAAVRAEARTYLALDSIADLSLFVRWRAAMALGDSGSLRSLRRSFSRAPSTSLRTIVLSSQYNGIGDGDARRALNALESRAAHPMERTSVLLARHARAMNGGDPDDALDATRALEMTLPLSTLGLRLRILDWLYGLGDSAAAAAAADKLRQRVASMVRPGDSLGGRGVVSSSGDDDVDVCTWGQWAATLHDAAAVERATEYLRRIESSNRTAHGASGLCAGLLGAMTAASGADAEAFGAVERLDSLLQFGPPAGEMRDYAGVALSRLYERLGSPALALGAVRRRPHMTVWPHFLSTHLREEGRLAAAAGDTAAAALAWRHFLALRSAPSGAGARETDEVRAALRKLRTP
jgi:DNA-binding SARP family transcriptional activator